MWEMRCSLDALNGEWGKGGVSLLAYFFGGGMEDKHGIGGFLIVGLV